MTFDFAALHWPAVLAAFVAAQLVSVVWFVVLFAEPWAKEYGAADAKAHTAEIPPYTYGVQIACNLVMVLSLALLHRAVGVSGLVDALVVGLFVIVGFSLATGIPGQAFLRRWRVAAIQYGSQAAMILVASTVLGAWMG